MHLILETSVSLAKYSMGPTPWLRSVVLHSHVSYPDREYFQNGGKHFMSVVYTTFRSLHKGSESAFGIPKICHVVNNSKTEM